MVKSRSVDLDGKSWGDANTECIAHGASLASIHSDHVQDGIYNTLRNKALDLWIGLQANSKHKFSFKLHYLFIYFISKIKKN